MGLKERVMELVRAGDVSGLETLVASEPGAVRYLMGRLWDPGEAVRETASKALGAAAAAHPDLGSEILRRIVWGLNDESATNGVYGVPAFAEIGVQAPEVAAPFVGPVASFLWDEGLRGAILDALERIAAEAPQILEPAVDHLQDLKSPQDHDLVERVLGHLQDGNVRKEVSNGT
jgi:hypothetical protein